MTKVCTDNTCKHPIIPRSDWGASPPRPSIENNDYKEKYNVDPKDAYTRIVMHHSGFKPEHTPSFVQRKAFDFGYDDFEYHFYITEDGAIYEGRELKYIGAHAGETQEANARHDLKMDPDFGSIGIAIAGCFHGSCKEGHKPVAAQQAAFISLVTYLRGKYKKIGVDDIMGHSEVYDRVIFKAHLTPKRPENTVCPGEVIDWVRQLRNEAKGK